MRSFPSGLLFAAALLLPVLAQAVGYDPITVRDDIAGETVQYQPAMETWAHSVRVFQGGADDTGSSGVLWVLPVDLGEAPVAHVISSADPSSRLIAPASAAPWTDGRSLVADPASNTIWVIDPSQDPATLSVFAATGLAYTGAKPTPLCSPVAVATQLDDGEGEIAWFAEGAPPGTGYPWYQHAVDCLAGVGGLQLKTVGGDTDVIVSEGNLAYELPKRPVKGLAFTEAWGQPELFSVVGEAPFGDSVYVEAWDRGRVLRIQVNPGDSPVDNWSILPDLVDGHPDEAQLGQPRFVAPLDGKRLAIAGPEGIMVVDVQGNLLDLVYAMDGTPPDGLQGVLSVLGLASSSDGTALYALFETGQWARKLAVWDATGFLYHAEDVTICVDPEMDSAECELVEEEDCQARCPTISEAIAKSPSGARIRVPPGTYEEHLMVAAKALTLEAEIPGTVRLVGSAWPAVQVYYNGPPGLMIDGFVIEGGQGLELPYLAGTVGGGVLVAEAALTMTRTLVTGGEAYYGGGMAAVAPREVILEGVGFARNLSSYGGAFTVQGGWMHPTAPVTLSYATLARNEATVLGGAMCLASARITANSVIIADNGAQPLCYLETGFGGMEAEIHWSDLWPQTEWLVYDAGSGGVIDLAAQGMLGDGVINADPMFVAIEDLDFHLIHESPCVDAGDPGNLDPDGTRSDMGMYGFFDWMEGDDDDSGSDDDDSALDDDDVLIDDDDDGDDDDSTGLAELLPSGFRCDCSTASGSSGALVGLLVLFLAVTRRRR